MMLLGALYHTGESDYPLMLHGLHSHCMCHAVSSCQSSSHCYCACSRPIALSAYMHKQQPTEHGAHRGRDSPSGLVNKLGGVRWGREKGLVVDGTHRHPTLGVGEENHHGRQSNLLGRHREMKPDSSHTVLPLPIQAGQ